MPSIEINFWLQEAIEFRLREHVKRIVMAQIPKDVTIGDVFYVNIDGTDHSYGFINVSWSYNTNNRGYSTRESGTESFTLDEVLRICMTELKEME